MVGHQDTLCAAKVISGLTSGEFLIKMKVPLSLFCLWVMMTLPFPLGMSRGILYYLLLWEYQSWKETPACSREEGEAGRDRSWWKKESQKDHSTWSSGCVQIAKLISLQETKQISIGLEYGSSRLQQYVLLLPSSWELSWVCKLRKNLPKGKKKQRVEAEEQSVFQPEYSKSGTERNKEPHSCGMGVIIISDGTIRYLKCYWREFDGILVLHWQCVHEGLQQGQGSRMWHEKGNRKLVFTSSVVLWAGNTCPSLYRQPSNSVMNKTNLPGFPGTQSHPDLQISLKSPLSKSYCSVVDKQHSKACNVCNLEFDVGITWLRWAMGRCVGSSSREILK